MFRSKQNSSQKLSSEQPTWIAILCCCSRRNRQPAVLAEFLDTFAEAATCCSCRAACSVSGARLQTRMQPIYLYKTLPGTAALPNIDVSSCAHLVQQNQGPLFGHNLTAVSSQRARCCRPAPQQQLLAMQHHYTSEGPSESPCKLQLQKPSRGCHLFAEMCCKKTRNNVAYTAIGQQQSSLTLHCHIKLSRQCKPAVRPGLALTIPSDRTDFSSLHCAS